MRNLSQWDNRIRKVFIKQFTPRIQFDLLRLSEPDNLPEEPESCFIYGEPGNGKTIYACWLLLREQRQLYLTDKTESCEFISVPELIQKIKVTFNNSDITEQEILNHYSSVHLLVLDDLGTVKCTDWTYQILYLIINNRYENMKKTIITSNLNLEQLSNYLGDDRITSRIERMGKIIKKEFWNGRSKH